MEIGKITVKKYIHPNSTHNIRKVVQNKNILNYYKKYINDLFIKRNILLKLSCPHSNNIKDLSDRLLYKIYILYLFFKNTISLLTNKLIYL